LSRSFGPLRAVMLCLVMLCVPVLVAPSRYLASNSFANGKKTPAEPVEPAPRPTPISRKGGDRGIGGTGLNDDRGIGGTGFVGPITRFGSIFVNGAEIFYDPTRDVVVDGKPRPASAMKIGYVARVSASGSKGEFTATQIAIDHEVLGPISAMAADKTELTVLGQKVDISAIDGSETLKLGDWVAVSGLRRADDAIAATLIETIAPTTAQIVGLLKRADGRPMIGTVPLLGPIAPKFMNERVIVRGEPVGTGLRVRNIAEAEIVAKRGNIHRISIEGYFRRIGQKVVLPADPEVRLIGKPGNDLIDAGGPEAALKDGNSPSIVDGNVEPNGAISITNIRALDTRFEGRGGPDMSPQAPGSSPNTATGDPGASQGAGKANQSRTGETEDGSHTGTTGTGGETENEGGGTSAATTGSAGTTTGSGTGTTTTTGSGAKTGTSPSGTGSDSSESSGANTSGQSRGGQTGSEGSRGSAGSGSNGGSGAGHGKDN